jgi:predicted dehydrogenase
VRRSGTQVGETAVVFGLGLVGLLVLQIARASGARTIALDLDEARVERARALGASHAWKASGHDTIALVREATSGVGADQVLLCHASTSSDPTNAAIRMCRRRGRVVVVGAFGLDIEREPFFKGEVDLLISTSLGPGRYDPSYEERGRDYPFEHVRWTEQRNLEEFLRLVAVRAVDVRSLTDLVRPLEEAPQAYEALTSARPRPVGVLLSYAPRPAPAEEAEPARPGKGARRLSIVGAGEFTRAVHLPIILRRGFEVAAVANRTPLTAQAAARECGPSTRALADWRTLVQDPSVELVLVSTRHDSHAKIASAALEAGKHVFLEKPVATTREGLETVVRAREKRRDRLLVLGHNRRFSAYAISLEAQLRERRPCMLVYRVNAPFVPASSWIQDASSGGGRIVGEGTHFLDLLGFLTGDPSPILVEAFAAPPDGRAVPGRDSYQALLRHADGSLATLIYSAQGSPGLGKERIEVQAKDASFVLDDFRSLEAIGPGTSSLRGDQDKGHERLWEELEKALRGEPSLVPPPEVAFAATLTAFEIEERIRGFRA